MGVTVIGLGPMGQAMVGALLGGGHAVTVWNRTASRAGEVVAKGAVLVDTAADAVAANELVILSLTDYQAMYDILGSAELSGRVLVNLSSDTPERTREAAAWAAERGARFLTGGVMVPAPVVGTEAAYVFYSGPEDALRRHEDALRLIGDPRFVGADPALAQLYYQAQLDIFLTGLSTFLHATALLASAGVAPRDFLPYAVDNANGLSEFFEEAVTAIENGEYPGDLATAAMMGATADHIVGASEAAGIDTALPKAVKSHYDKVIDAGYGKDSWSRLYEVIAKNRT